MPRAGLTTDGLTVAAADLADDVGYGRLTLSELARRVGVRPASLYAHLGSLDELLARVSALALADLADRGEAAVAGRAGRDAIAALADAHRGFAAQHPGRYDATLHRPAEGVPADVVGRLTAAGLRHARMTEALLRAYDVPPGQRVHAIRLLGSLLRGFVDIEHAGGFAHSAPSAQKSWEWMLDVVDHALRTSFAGVGAATPRPRGSTRASA